MKVTVDEREIRALAFDEWTGAVMLAAAEGMADNARGLAPGGRLNRASREGIVADADLTPTGWVGRCGHVARAYGFYLARLEFGTKYHNPQPHLRPASTMPVDLQNRS